jgi:hypothetical protein
MEKRRTILSLVLVGAGAVLLIYGLFAHAGEVWPADKAPTPSSVTVDPVIVEPVAVAVITPEPGMIREITIGGLIRTDQGQLKKTYSGQAPKACPT